MILANETIKKTLKAKLKDIGIDLDEPGIDREELAEQFRKVNISTDDLICAGHILENVFSGKGMKSNLEITDGAAFALSYLFARIQYRLNKSIDGGQFVDRFANSFLKTIHLAKSQDKKQRRVSTSVLNIFVNSFNSSAPAQQQAEQFSSFIEVVEELPAPRKGKKVRVQTERGRPKGSGGYKKSDRELLLKFKEEHGRLPKFKAEYEALAPSAGGKDSKDPYDRDSTIKRLERAVSALRKEGF
jgi:hypothetical protein